MSNRQAFLSSILLGIVCAAVVWYLEQFNRERMIRDFKAVLDGLPTHFKEGTE